jgi:hypothetical protein
VTTDFRAFKKSPVFAGLFCCVLLLSACQADSPETVTRLFWLALAGNHVNAARQLATDASRDLVGKVPQSAWKIDTLKTGEVRIDGAQAVVETEVEYDRPKPAHTLRFDTFLVREKNAWKVDYRKTRDYMLLHPFGELLQNLQNLGETFGEQLQKQLPQIEEGIQLFGEQLNEQLKQFERDLEKAFPPPPKRQNPSPGNTI